MQTYFNFGQYTLRQTVIEDIHLAIEWTALDYYHQASTFPFFWLENIPGREAYLLIDSIGPVFFFKMHRLPEKHLELHIQFMPLKTAEDRKRTRAGLIEGMTWLKTILSQTGITRVSFLSSNPDLSRFCRRRLGFAVEGQWLHLDL